MKSTKNFTRLHIVSVRLESQEKRTKKKERFFFFLPGEFIKEERLILQADQD
jgi:hypothetical protein